MASSKVCLLVVLPIWLAIFTFSLASGSVSPPIRAVNLGEWLVIEGWITPELFKEVDSNALMDGTLITLRSVTRKMFLSAAGGGGSTVAADKSEAQDWETFRLWKMESSDHMFKIRANQDQFISVNGDGQLVATTTSPGQAGEFQIVTNKDNRVQIKAPNGKFLQVHQSGSVTANSEASGSWSNNDSSVFDLQVTGQMQGDTQICSFYGAEKAVSILQGHWNTFIVEDDFSFISSNGLNAVRIPIAWWITKETNSPSCHPPSYPGYQAVLDKAFDWADKYNLSIIVDLHAAPWSQNGHDHSASRDGTVGWGTSDANIDQTVQVIAALAARYASRKSLLAIELLNEPQAPNVRLDTLKRYYTAGYNAVKAKVERHDVYVIMSNRLNISDPTELANFTSKFSNCVLDVHYYNKYDKMFSGMNWKQNIDFVETTRLSQLKSLMQANGALIFVGEWAVEWDVNDATDEQVRKFADAQMGVWSGLVWLGLLDLQGQLQQ